MPPRFLLVTCLFVTSAVIAQPPGANWGNLPYLTQVTQAANQLFYSVEQLNSAVGTLRHPQAPALQRQLGAYYEDTLRFSRMLERNPPRPQVEQEYRRLDRRGDEVVKNIRTFAAANQNSLLYQLASSVEFADQRLAAAVIGGGPTPPPAGDLVRLTRTLDRQSDDLLRIARETLKSDPISQQLERHIRGFSAAVDQFRRLVETNGDVAGGFAGVQSAWTAVTQNLSSGNFLWESTALRQSAVQVSGLVTTLSRLIGGNVPAPPPWPPFNPDRKRSIYAVGADAGGGPHVRVFQSARAGDMASFMAYSPDFRGGVRVAIGDVDGDGVKDIITAPGPGMPPLVRVFSGRDLSLIREFLAFDAGFTGGVWVAAASFNKNGRTEIVCGADRGGAPIVRVFDVITGQKFAEFLAYEAGFRGGARVAIGDVNGDGVPDIITAPGPGRAATIRVFDGRNANNVLSQFDAYDPTFLGGAFVATGDFGRDGRKELFIGPDAGGGSHCKLVNGLTGQVAYSFFPVDQNFAGGIRVACCDVNGDGVPDFICTTGPGAPTAVRIFNGRGGQLLNEFLAFDPAWTGGAFVGCR
jgi:hypothetical protein